MRFPCPLVVAPRASGIAQALERVSEAVHVPDVQVDVVGLLVGLMCPAGLTVEQGDVSQAAQGVRLAAAVPDLFAQVVGLPVGVMGLPRTRRERRPCPRVR